MLWSLRYRNDDGLAANPGRSLTSSLPEQSQRVDWFPSPPLRGGGEIKWLEENLSAWGWPVRPERDCAGSQPQQPAQFNAPQVIRQVCWLATSLRLVFDTTALRQRGFALPLRANSSFVRARRILSQTTRRAGLALSLPERSRRDNCLPLLHKKWRRGLGRGGDLKRRRSLPRTFPNGPARNAPTAPLPTLPIRSSRGEGSRCAFENRMAGSKNRVKLRRQSRAVKTWACRPSAFALGSLAVLN